MLKDAVRTLQYRAAIFEHARDRVVLDLGCGSGVLSIFAAQAGAQHVYAVERTSLSVLANLMFKANGVDDRITLLRDDSRNIKLPVRADLLVHEILGSDPLAEGIVPILDDARERLLRPEGRLLPGRLEVCAIGLDAQRLPLYAERTKKEVEHLSTLYGVNFSPLDLALQTWDTTFLMSTDHGESALDHLLTDETVLWDLDLSRSLEAQVATPTRSVLRARHHGRLAGVVLFFRAHLDEKMILSTSPYAHRTHWDFTFYDLSRIVAVAPGDEMQVTARVEFVEDRQRIFIDFA